MNGLREQHVVANDPLRLRRLSPFPRNSLLGRRNELKTKMLSFARKLFKSALFVLFFILFLADVDVTTPKLEHTVNQKSQFMSSGDDAFGLPQTGTHSSTISAESATADEQTLGTQPEDISCAAGGFAGGTMEHFASADFVVRAQRQPRRKMFFCFPWTQVHADFSQKSQCCRFMNAVNFC